MGDVDLLVKPEDLDRAGRVLEGDGFLLENDTHVHHRAYVRERTETELHFAVGGFPGESRESGSGVTWRGSWRSPGRFR